MRIAIARLPPLDQEDLDAIIPEVVAAFVPLAQAYESYFEMWTPRRTGFWGQYRGEFYSRLSGQAS